MILFKNIRLISPIQNLDRRTDILIVDGIISKIEDNIIPEVNSESFDGSKWICSVGLYDMHVHLREPGGTHKETIETGCSAASNGGFTGVCCMPNTNPTIDSVEVVHSIQFKSQNLPVDVHCSAAITKNRKGEELSNIGSLYESGVRLFTDDGDCLKSPEVMRRAFEYLSMFEGATLSQHCEENSMTKNSIMNEGFNSTKQGYKGYPSVAEEIIVNRDIQISSFCDNGRYHVQHLSTKGTVDIVRKAKASGVKNVTCEVTPHHFVLTDDAIELYGSNAKMNPPLRLQSDIDEVINGLIDGTIDVIATDHAPHSFQEKEQEINQTPNGIIGLETSLGLTLTYLVNKNHISVNKMIELMSINPRKIMGLKDIKIDVGEVANLSIFDPIENCIVDSKKFKTKSLNTPFNSFALSGKPICIINKSKIVWSEL